MSQNISTLDRLRIERAVWSLDSRLQDLPWRSRVAKRRELRANLLDASADVGAPEALRRVGSIRGSRRSTSRSSTGTGRGARIGSRWWPGSSSATLP